MNTIEKIKSIRWDNRVKRFGFLQSKGIANEAEVTPITLTEGIEIKYDNVFWVQDFNLYDEEKTQEFSISFREAFEKDKDWPLRIIEHFDIILPKLEEFIQKLKNKNWEDKLTTFIEYVNFLLVIQKYYVVAVPLTNFCESKVTSSIVERYAVPYKELAINNIKNDFKWLKTTYNVIEEVHEEEFKSKEIEKKEKKEIDVDEGIRHFVIGLQVGIYTRNRMKELSQMLWFYIEDLAVSIAEDLKIGRDDFFYLTYREVTHAYETGELPDFKERKKGFAIGYLDNKEIILTGKESKELFEYYDTAPEESEIKGNTACKGKAEGKVKIIMNVKDFHKFEEGNILVTSMTTPEFVVIMKKAAAIITDEGGLSCHAAIVSREVNIPCIIGTKHASKLLKDDDLIEVDASEGVVRKLK